MAGRAEYGVNTPCENCNFFAIEKYTGKFQRKISFLHICAVCFIGPKIPELLWGTVFSGGGDADVR